jgi:hypothetical protein
VAHPWTFRCDPDPAPPTGPGLEEDRSSLT